jgi:protein-tyrosine phosphatase
MTGDTAKAGASMAARAGAGPGGGDPLPPPGAGLGLATAPNLRDVGGWPTRDGARVVRGALYRSTDLSRLAGSDVQALAGLGIRSVYDLRTEGERDTAPDILPPGAVYHPLDVLGDSTMAVPANLMALLADPPAATEALTGARVRGLFDSAYREIVGLPSALAGYRAMFTDLADAAGRPALVHCTTGKDRTGWAVAALLMLVEVSEDDVMAEYLVTNDLLLPALEPMFAQFRDAGGDPSVLVPVLGVEREYLTSGLDEMTRRFGSIEGYFSEGLGLDAPTIDRLRLAFTTTAPESRSGAAEARG